MGTKKGLRAQEQQAQESHELSGGSAGFREPGPARTTVERPATTNGGMDDSHSSIGPTNTGDSDDIEDFEDGTDDELTDEEDEENDLA